jgi:hypothetical protein
MKKSADVRHQLKQVIFRHRKRHVIEGMKRRPKNCKHNGVVQLPVHTSNRAEIHVCRFQNGEGWNNRVCDSSMGGDLQARECKYFECENTAESLKDEIAEKMGLDGTPVKLGELARDYPDVAALLWVLGPNKHIRAQAEDEPNPNILAFFGDDPIAEVEAAEEKDDESESA